MSNVTQADWVRHPMQRLYFAAVLLLAAALPQVEGVYQVRMFAVGLQGGFVITASATGSY